MNKKKIKNFLIWGLTIFLLIMAAKWYIDPSVPEVELPAPPVFDTLPEYTGEAYVAVNDNKPFFEDLNLTVEYLEEYSVLDDLGRCGIAMACVSPDTLPEAERESISHIYPSGWKNKEYDFVDGGMLYNRCHLIGFQLTGENDNERNLITGTRYMNVEGMLPFENMIADYVKETGRHVVYRVTPIFVGNELVARGVLMEAQSVEDYGAAISFCAYAFNVQPGVKIDYLTGENEVDEDAFTRGEQGTYVLNTNSRKFHLPECSGASSMSEKNRQDYTGSREMLILQGYEPCSQCNP